MSLAAANSYRDAGIAYMRARDWDSAEIEFLSALAEISTSPDMKKGDSEITFRNEVQSLIDICHRKAASAAATTSTNVGGMRVSKITYQDPTE